MTKRPVLPPPPSVDRRVPVPKTDPNDVPDPNADFDEWEPDLTEDFDSEDWPDDAPGPFDDVFDEAPDLRIDDDPIGHAPDDLPLAGDDDLEILHADLPLDDDLLDEPVVVPWKTSGHLPEHDVTLPVVLEVTEAHSHWVGGPGGQTRVIIAGLALEVELIAIDGSPQQIRLGRDAISGRLLVQP
jgi:hypothetical protein